MDPNEARRRLLFTARRILDQDSAGLPVSETLALALAEGFLDLDQWLLMGGFAPSAWPHEITGDHVLPYGHGVLMYWARHDPDRVPF